MFDPLKDIKDFHEKFGLAYQGAPRHIPEDLAEFRFRFMREELEEYGDTEDLEKKLDALVDLMYVLLGTAYLHGFNRFVEAWTRVHKANMQKVRAERVDQSTRQSIYDVVKPAGWTPPRLDDLVV
jgi:predicted HAD superfamily Cof-like phosphohydrolase